MTQKNCNTWLAAWCFLPKRKHFQSKQMLLCLNLCRQEQIAACFCLLLACQDCTWKAERSRNADRILVLSHWTEKPLTPTNIWFLSSAGKGTIGIHSQVRWLLCIDSSSDQRWWKHDTPFSPPFLARWWCASKFWTLVHKCCLISGRAVSCLLSVSIASASPHERCKDVTSTALPLASAQLSCVSDAFVTSNMTQQKKTERQQTNGSRKVVNQLFFFFFFKPAYKQ